MLHNRTLPACSGARAAERRLWPRLVAAIAVLLPIRNADGQTVDAYTGAGFQPVLATTVVGPFTGCTKDQSYSLADGSRFVCTRERTAFAVNPKATLLQNPDGTVTVLIIDGTAYAGTFIRGTGGMRASPVPTSADPPEPVKPPQVSPAVGAILPTEPVTAVTPVRDIATLRNEAIQEYPPRSVRKAN